MARITRACVVVLGDTPVVHPGATQGLPVVRRELSDPLDDMVVALIVADRATHDTVSLARVVRSSAFDGTPVLVVAAESPSDAELEALGATDCLVETEPGAIADRRIAALVELGVGRLALSIAEQALEQSVNGLSVADVSVSDAPLIYVSSVFQTITGYQAEEVEGRNCRMLQGAERDQVGIPLLRDAIKRRTSATAVLRNYRKDGSPFWNEVTLFPIRLNGRPTPWMGGVQHDVTTLREAQAAVTALCRQLTDQQLFDHAILDGIDVGIITTDGEGMVTFANRAAHGILRLVGEASGTNVTSLLALEKPPRDLLGLQPRIVLSHVVPDVGGAPLELDLSLTRGEAVHDERVGFFFIFRDEQEERAFEEERHRFERLVAMGTMVAGFAHEVRNPVAALRSIAEEMEEVLLEAGLKLPHAGRMLKVLERIERLVQTSLQYGRPATPKPGRHRPWSVLSAALAAVGPRTRSLGGDLRVEVEPELRDVICDDVQIAQALVILLDNALDATGDPSRVLLRATADRPGDEFRLRKSQPPLAQCVRLEVIDEGPGIPSDIIPRIFDPFFTTKAQGTGLGLAIAQQIVSENRGRVEVSSPRGGPTTFSVLLPTS